MLHFPPRFYFEGMAGSERRESRLTLREINVRNRNDLFCLQSPDETDSVLAQNFIPAHRKSERRRKLPGFLFGSQTFGSVWLHREELQSDAGR